MARLTRNRKTLIAYPVFHLTLTSSIVENLTSKLVARVLSRPSS